MLLRSLRSLRRRMVVAAKRAPTTIATLRLLVASSQHHTHTQHSSTISSHRMPFSLRSDEELIAEARRALEALGVEVVIDSTSSSLEECVQRHELDLSSSKVAILTSRAAVEESAPSEPVEMCAAFLATLVYIPDLGVLSCLRTMLWRTLEQVDVAAGIVAWWRRMHADPGWRGTGFTCCRCRKRHPAPMTPHACQQCQADICARCMQQLSLHRCTVCRAWCVGPTLDGVPWDMPRPAPTRREAIAATAAAPSTTSALPQRMAAATGSDGWLRLPPQHQRMHPVDVLVDGVLAALDGCVSVRPSTRDTCPAPKDDVAFTRLPLSDTILEGVTLDSVRRRLKQAVDGLMPQVSAAPVQEVLLAVSTLRQVVLVGAGIAGFFSREQNVSWTSCHAAVSTPGGVCAGLCAPADGRPRHRCKARAGVSVGAGVPQGGARPPRGGQARGAGVLVHRPQARARHLGSAHAVGHRVAGA